MSEDRVDHPPEHERIALVTGASSGIGRAIARQLVKGGFRVALVARQAERLDEVAGELQALGGEVLPLVQDLTEFDRLAGLVETIEQKLGPLSVLVNNAGMGYTGSLVETSVSDWQRVLTLNLTAPFALTREVLGPMRARRRGTIVNMVSIAAQRAFPDWGAYCVSKSGLLAFSRTLAQEVRNDGIRVSALCPGSVDTALWDSDLVNANFDRTRMLQADTVAQLVLMTVTLPESAVLEEAVLMPGFGAF